MKRKISEKVRRAVYERDRGKCQEIGCESSRSNGDTIHLHHVKPEQFGGAETPDNLISLCDIHHKAMHAEFHAFYPDSLGILYKMNHSYKKARSRLRKALKVDDGYDLMPYLEYLTGHSEFRGGQLETIRAALEGKDVLLVTPTGTGKSVCYQLPGFINDNPSLVISPLKALMKDQVTSIWKKKIPATYINSDLSEAEKQKRFEFIKQDLYKFLFVAPERFFKSKDPANHTLYKQYGYLVIDEAHAIDLWGKAFRSSYSKIGLLRDSLGNPPVIALTATASQETQKIISQSLHMQTPEIIVKGFYRNNIQIIKHFAGLVTDDGTSIQKNQYIVNLAKNTLGQKKLIFVPTKKTGSELLNYLRSNKIDAEFYYGDLDVKSKMYIQDRFTGIANPKLETLISTSAFGMGIDIPDIRHIVHWSPALGIEDYYQQIGRAGRDQKQSYAHLLFHESDEGLLRYLATVTLNGEKFKDEHGYTDADVERVNNEVINNLEQMIDLMDVKDGDEWDYILNYFGQTKPTFWDQYGMKIADAVINTGIVLSTLALLIGIIGKINGY